MSPTLGPFKRVLEVIRVCMLNIHVMSTPSSYDSKVMDKVKGHFDMDIHTD